MYNDGDIVWVNLGPSYGWWPATVVHLQKKKLPLEDGTNVLKEKVQPPAQKKRKIDESSSTTVRFFDDHDRECYTVPDIKRLCLYSDKKKKVRLIKAGLKKFQAKKGKSSMFDYQARQAQFYKVIIEFSIEMSSL